MKSRKLLFSLILAFGLCFALAAPAWAADDSVAQMDVTSVNHMLPYPPTFSTHEDGIEPYGKNKPTTGWDFKTQKTYHGDFSSTKSTLYTNYYFYLGTYLKMTFSAEADIPKLPFSIGACCLTCNHQDLGILGSFDTGYVGNGGVHSSVKLYGGQNHTGHYVYFYIRNDQPKDGLSGLGTLEGTFYIESF